MPETPMMHFFININSDSCFFFYQIKHGIRRLVSLGALENYNTKFNEITKTTKNGAPLKGMYIFIYRDYSNLDNLNLYSKIQCVCVSVLDRKLTNINKIKVDILM